MEQALVTVNVNGIGQRKIETFQDAVEETMGIVVAQIDRINKAVGLEAKSNKRNNNISKEIAELVKMLEKLNEIYQSNDMFKRGNKGPGILTKIFGRTPQ